MWPLLQSRDSTTSSLREAEKLPDLPSTSQRPGLYYLTEQRGVLNSHLPIKKKKYNPYRHMDPHRYVESIYKQI